MNQWIIAGTLLVCFSCAQLKQKHTTKGKTPPLENSLSGEHTAFSPQRPSYHAAEPILTDLIHTKLEIHLDWKKSRLNGLATLTLRPHFYPSDSLLLDAKGMDILHVRMGQQALNYTYDSSRLSIKLGKTFTRNESYNINISFVAKPEERRSTGSEAITSDKGLYFINPKGENTFKMPQVWTQGETESNSVWFPTIDAPNTKTSQELLITVEDKYVTLSNGKLISSKRNADGTRTDHWKQELPHAPYLVMFAVGEFKIVKDSYTRPDGSVMEVNYYVEKEWEPFARAIFGETPEMIRFFSQLLGVEYPWDKYDQMVVRDFVSGAMENTGSVIFGDYVYKNHRELLDENDQSTIAHELFHHWFGDLVTCESWSNLPLNESFANYGQYLWDAHRYGLDEADYQSENETEGYFQSAQISGFHDLIWFDYSDREEMFDAHSYNKGGRILHMLRKHLGDEAFFKGLQLYLTNNRFKTVEVHQLRLAFEEVSGEDLNWFFNQWFLAAGHPVLEIKQRIDTLEKKVVLRVKQSQNLEESPIYRLPVDVAVFDGIGKKNYKVVIDNVYEEFTFPYEGNLNGVLFDEQQMLLAKIEEEKPASQYVFQFYHGHRYKARKTGLVQGSKSKSPEAQQMILDALKDPFWDIRLEAIKTAAKLEPTYKMKGRAYMRHLATSDNNSRVRSSAISFLASNADSTSIKAICLDRISNDSSYLVISNALNQLSKINPALAIEKAVTLENERSSKLIASIAQLYGSYGTKEQFYFFEKVLKNNILQEFNQLSVVNAFTYFISRQEIEVMRKSWDIYAYINQEGGYYSRRFLPQNMNYVIAAIDKKITEIAEKINTYEKTEDSEKVEECQRQKMEFAALKMRFNSLLELGKK